MRGGHECSKEKGCVVEGAIQIAELLAVLPLPEVFGRRQGAVTGVTSSSQEVTPGGCFVAVRGRRADGHTYIADALARGAALVVGEDPPPPNFPGNRTYARVADARRAVGSLAAAFYRHPTHSMEVIGVTGTDGKTTTSTLIDAIATASGRRTGLMSTVDFKIGDTRRLNNSRYTTLEAPEVQALLAEMRDAGVRPDVVERNSRGLVRQLV